MMLNQLSHVGQGGVLRALRSNWRGKGNEDGKVDGEQMCHEKVLGLYLEKLVLWLYVRI